jgi:putative membrane protein
MTGGISIRNLNLHGLVQHKVAVATGIAILVHVVGLLGMVGINRAWFVSLTPLNLLLMSVLLVWTQERKSGNFYRFLLIAFATGMTVEIIGVNTGLLFGRYTYGDVLGPGIGGVPLVIGMNWFVVMIASVSAYRKIVAVYRSRFKSSRGLDSGSGSWRGESAAAAVLAVLFDWIMEPAATRLGFWTWGTDGSIPLFNYACWFLVSFFLVSVMRTLRAHAYNPFAINLLLIQAVFFLLIRFIL